MRMRRLVSLSGVLAHLAVPAFLVAQTGGSVEFFGALDAADVETRTIGGMSLGMGTSFVGIRASGGLGTSTMSSFTPGTSGPTSLAWSTDADLLLGPLHARRGVGFMPYTFAGIGVMSGANTGTSDIADAIRTWSYGGGVQLSLGSIVSVSGEARSRRLAAPASYADSQLVRGLEFRAGIGLHFGGSPSRSRIYSRRGSDRSPPRSRLPKPSSRPRTWPISNTAGIGAARRVVPEGEKYLGVPYKWGGSSPRSGFDCSGFVQYIYGSQGVELPRTSRQMAAAGIGVNANSLAIGDLMLFAQNGRINHVAVYAGNGRIIHSTASGGGVRYDDLNSRRGKWFADRLVSVRRVSGDSRVIVNALVAAANVPFDSFDSPDSAPPAR